VGFRAFELYDVAAAETHVFVEASPDSVVQRLYWFQVEQTLPESDHRYDYSELPRRWEWAGLPFMADTRYGPAYSLDDVDPESDTAQVLRLLTEAGYRLSPELMRIRMVTLDDSRRRELLIIYLENPALHDLSARVLDTAGDAAWQRIGDRLQNRALNGIEVLTESTEATEGAEVSEDTVATEDTEAVGPGSEAAAEPATAATIERLEVGAFAFEHELMLAASPEQVWDAITGDLSGWWDHNFSGDPAQFFLEPWPGGRFLEVFEEGSRDGVLHGTVTFAKRPEMLRFEGPLGLTGYAVHGVYTYQIEPMGESTRLTLSVRMTGEMRDGWPEAVEGVWRHFLYDGLRPFLEGRTP
jgi:uncharacterized protein YndB with AHSA1/START domain